ncbi:MerR family transcriptional regulator [Pedobacter insulae]|uniref:DNA-binding transcriptional regulator, MerR family n=1 Tax=Pedobacter insulae TaxID=414048 RepID=A0A1I2WEP9_9SPHI|nr:MerR family transcriptional regulator [Pedobacter insulae]SFG99810.1 DNA-binding transcriptional regulator, MerR family [Pedobacter insulae]
MSTQSNYSVKQLAKLAGVTVKTLHLYDHMGLLKPAQRTGSRYRLYCESELLRLQQILFYRELDFPLKQILAILDDPNFDLIKAMEGHKTLLKAKRRRIDTLMKTLNQTLISLKNKTMLNLEDLYQGLSEQEAQNYRNQAISSYGEEAVTHAENHLKSLSKEAMQALVSRQKELGKSLYQLKHLKPANQTVQELVGQHYQNTRKLWGTHQAVDKQAEAYQGLGQLYLTDERFTSESGETDPDFRIFISEAMSIYSASLH